MFRFMRPQRTIVSVGKLPSWREQQARTIWRHGIQGVSMEPQRNIFSMSRLPLRVEQRRQMGQNVQKVRFHRPGMRLRTFFTSACVLYACYYTYCIFVLDPLERAAVEALKHLPQEDEEEVEKPLFIPFPGTTKEVKPMPYRGSDPEWQEFIKFSKDQALAKRVRDELAQFVRKVAEKHPVLKMRCGKDVKLRRYWLDVDFPTYPPPEYERSGIEISDEYISWTTMPVDSLTVHRIRQAFWPSALVQSSWSFTKTLFLDDTKRLARFLGIQTNNPSPNFETFMAQHQQMMNRPMPTKDGPTKAPQGFPDARKAIPKTPTLARSELPRKAAEGPDQSNEVKKPGEEIYAHFFRAIMAFKLTLSKTWRPAPNYPPRGSILVGGLVELDTPRAWLVFDVKAAWDPKTRQYDPRSMHIALRRMQMKKQGPLGGA